MDTVKKWIIGFALALIGTASVWIANIDSKTFDSPEQKVTVVKAVETMPSEADNAVAAANDAHAVEIRQLRYEDQKRKDSIEVAYRRHQDSITLDYIKRQTVQIEQMKEEMQKIKDND